MRKSKNTDIAVNNKSNLEHYRNNWRNLIDSIYKVYVDELLQDNNSVEEIENIVSFLNTVVSTMTTKEDRFFELFDSGITLYKYIQLMRKNIDPIVMLFERTNRQLSQETIEHRGNIVNILVGLINQLSDDVKTIDDMDASNLDIPFDKVFRKSSKDTNEITEFLKSKIPREYIIPNDIVAREIISNKEMLYSNNQTPELIHLNAGKKGGREVVTYCCLQYEKDDFSIVYSRGLTAYDGTVHNAVCTLYEAGNNIFTVDMVYRAMNGLRNTERVSDESMEKIVTSIDKMMFTQISIDCSDEMKARRWKNIKKEIQSPVFNAVKGIVTTPAGTVTAYKLLVKPIVYQYAQKKNQVLNVPFYVIETNKEYRLPDGKIQKGIKNSDNVIVFREYLLRRIEGMKNQNNKLSSDRILFKSVWEHCNIDTTNRQTLSKYRDYIKIILNYWIVINYIGGYHFVSDNGAIKGIDITIDRLAKLQSINPS